MRQVLFYLPSTSSFFAPDGVPIHGFGAMLFLAFLLVWVWGTVRARRIGMSAVSFQDFMIWVFISGLIGARLLYMIQYPNQFDQSFFGLILSFFKIWEGGIVFYGSVVGGVVGFGLFYWFIMRRMQISGWQLADTVAPLLALGLAIGRIGCFLNGCCWGQVACEECSVVPLGAIHFPLLPAPARKLLVDDNYLQTSTGFAIRSRDRGNPHEDPRSEVTAVEPGSPAAQAGLLPHDRIVKVNGKPNSIIVEMGGPEEQVNKAVKAMLAEGGRARNTMAIPGRARVEFDTLPAYFQGQEAARNAAEGLLFYPADYLDELAREWPRGKASLSLGVERDGKEIDLKPFKPQTIGLYPTQLYETVSMLLLILVLLAYYPLRHHDGEVMVVLMIGYAIHRFINESLRIEPRYDLGLTLSQWGSVIILIAAIAMEVYLLCVMPSRWKTSETPIAATQPAQESKTPSPPNPLSPGERGSQS